jgi:hypothetical protein
VPSLGATNSSLKRKQVKLLSHTPFTQNSKQSVSYLLSLKSWPPLVPVDWNHRGKGHATLDTLQDLVGPLWRMRPCWLLTLTTLGLLNWSENLAWIYISFHQSEGLVLQSSGRRPWNHIKGVHLLVPGIPTGCRAREWGPVTQWCSAVWSYRGLQKCCRKNVGPERTKLKPRWLEERKIYYAREPAPRSLQNGASPLAQVCWDLWQLAFHWEVATHTSKVTTYHTSTSVVEGHQLFLLEWSENAAQLGEEFLLAFRSFLWVYQLKIKKYFYHNKITTEDLKQEEKLINGINTCKQCDLLPKTYRKKYLNTKLLVIIKYKAISSNNKYKAIISLVIIKYKASILMENIILNSSDDFK